MAAAARAVAAKDRYDPAKPFYPWFHRVLKNYCIDRLRRRRHTARPGLDDRFLPDGAGLDRAPLETPESRCARRERERIVARGLAMLGEDLREMIELRHFRELSYAEMAETAHIPVGTVMSRLHRARRTLREAMAGMLEAPMTH